MTGRPCIVCDTWTDDLSGLCEGCRAERDEAVARAKEAHARRLETALLDLTLAAGRLVNLAGGEHRKLIEGALRQAREVLGEVRGG